MNDDMDVSHVPVTMPPPTSEPPRSKTAALAVHLNASPALDLTQQQRETWFYSKDILNQMEQALARLDHFRQEDATTQAIATGTRVVPLAQQVYTAAQLPGTSLETPLPSVWLGKLLPTAQTETPDINEGACSSITDQPDTLEYEQDCDAARNAFLSGMLKPIDCRQEGQAGGTACQAAAPGMAVKHGAIADPPASSHKKGVRRNRKRAVFLVGTGDNAAAAANARLPDSSEKRRAVGDKSPAKFRGVTQHKNSGRFEAHVWINTLKRQVYLGGYASDALAAEAFDIIQVKMKGTNAKTNFPIENYTEVMRAIKDMDIKEVIASVKREADSFSRGASRFRGLTRAATDSSLWEARIGLPPGGRHVYLGLFENEVDAAKAYDRASIRVKGDTAATNFSLAEHPDAIRDYRALKALVDEGCEVAIALSTSDDPKYVRMWETFVKHGMEGLRICSKVQF